MRVITNNIVRAFFAKREFKGKNTRTDGWNVWLHGNEIFRRHNHSFDFSLSGWPTPTTLDRINGLLNGMSACFRLCRHKGEVRAYPIHNRVLSPRQWVQISTYDWWNVREVEAELNNRIHYHNEPAIITDINRIKQAGVVLLDEFDAA